MYSKRGCRDTSLALGKEVNTIGQSAEISEKKSPTRLACTALLADIGHPAIYRYHLAKLLVCIAL